MCLKKALSYLANTECIEQQQSLASSVCITSTLLLTSISTHAQCECKPAPMRCEVQLHKGTEVSGQYLTAALDLAVDVLSGSACWGGESRRASVTGRRGSGRSALHSSIQVLRNGLRPLA